jgi:RING-type zinc-finger
MADEGKQGLLDLEKELSCSICTEIFYQPLTLLDCLHTFCGSCLKLWFAWQATQAGSRRSNPYTCPSCRATVRGTRPDAKITTLLDMYLQANPSKAKTPEEKEDIRKKYTPGENVIPKPSTRTGASAEEQRMIDEVRAMSLRESEARAHGSYERGTNHSTAGREGRRDGASEGDAAQAGSRRQVEHQSSLRSMIGSSDVDSSEMVDEIMRQITEDGLLDGVNFDEMNAAQLEEISERVANAYRERHVAHAARSSETRRAHQRREHGSSSSRHASRSTGRHHSRSASAADQPPGSSSHPPVSRPHLLEADAASGHRRRTSSESRNGGASRRSPGGAVREQAARSATDLSGRPQSSGRRERRPSDTAVQGRRATDPRPETTSYGGRRRSSGNSARSRPSLQSSPRAEDASGLIPVSSPPPEAARRTPFAEMPDTGRPTMNNDTSVMSTSPHTSPRSRSTLYPEPSITCDRCGKRNIQYDLHEYCAICNDGQFALCHRCYRMGAGCLHWFGFGRAAWLRFQTKAPGNPNHPHALMGRRYRHPRTETVQSVQAAVDNERRILTTEDPASRLQTGVFCAICHTYADDCFWKCEACNDGEWGFCNTCVNQGRCCTHPLLPLVSTTGDTSTSSPTPSSHRSNRNSASSFTPLTSPALVQSVPYPNLSNARPYRPLTFTVHCDICHVAIPPTSPRHHCFSCSEGDYDICTSCYASLVETGRISVENGEHGWRRCLQGHRMIMAQFEDTALGQRRVISKDLVGGVFLKEPAAAAARSGTSPGTSPFGAGSPLAADGGELEFSWLENGERKTRRVKRDLSPRPGTGAGASIGAGLGSSPSTSPRLNAVAAAAAAAAASQTSGSPAELPGSTPSGGGTGGHFPPSGGVGARLVARWAWLPADGVEDELSFPRGAEIREALDISREWAVGAYAGSTGVFPSGYVMRL